MLRCPPSRISLTPSDLNGLDERLAARQSARLAQQKASNVRLTHGPQRLTSSSFVSAEHNVGRKRPRSSVSEATFHNDRNSYGEVETPLNTDNEAVAASIAVTSPSNLEDSWKEAGSEDGPVRSLENVTQRQSPRRAMEQQRSTAQRSPGIRHVQARSENASQAQPAISLDGILEQPLEYSFFDQTPQMPPARQSRPVLGDIHADIYTRGELDHPVVEPPLGQRLLSSARARRWRVRSQDFQVRSVPEELGPGDSPSNAHENPHRRRRMNRAAPLVPEVIVHDEDFQMVQEPTLDPAAPAFVPRTRFGSVTRSFWDSGVTPFSSHHWGSLDSTRNASGLRIRSTSEQNINVQNPRRYRNSRLTESTSARRFPAPTPDLYMEQQRSITGFNQGTATTVQPVWDLDRYPILRSSSSTGDQRGLDGLLAPHSEASADATRSRYTPSPPIHALPGQGHRQSHFGIYSAFANNVGDGGYFPPRTRSASPAVSTISHSTPNLLSMPRSASRIDSRGISGSWSQSQSRPASQNRFSRMVSGASGISADDVPPRRSSRQELDAAEEFIRRRNSPLDELTERFSRMRSVGHSWSRPSGARSRPSLLNGDPFGQSPSINASEGRIETAVTHSRPSIPAHVPVGRDEQEEELTDADPVALSLALPPSSPLPSGAQIVPSSPPLHESFSTSPRQPLAQLSPSKSPDLCTSPIVRKPLPRTATTPKVNVYDDSQPPDTQPQTPADVARSKRARAESVNRFQQSPVIAARTMIDSLPEEIMSRTSRQTYGPATTQATAQLTVLPPVTSHSTVVPSLSGPMSRDRTRTRTRIQRQSGSEQIENDMERQLSGMEEDRRTWLSRHGTGTLDVTPPKEGRFERFLS